MQYSFDLNITPEELENVEQAYNQAYNMSVQDVIEVLLKQSNILGACPFYPEVTDVTEKYAQWEAETPDIDWRDPEAVARFMEEDD